MSLLKNWCDFSTFHALLCTAQWRFIVACTQVISSFSIALYNLYPAKHFHFSVDCMREVTEIFWKSLVGRVQYKSCCSSTCTCVASTGWWRHERPSGLFSSDVDNPGTTIFLPWDVVSVCAYSYIVIRFDLDSTRGAWDARSNTSQLRSCN